MEEGGFGQGGGGEVKEVGRSEREGGKRRWGVAEVEEGRHEGRRR